MKRALAIAVALCTLGFAGFSQIAIKGSWTASLCYQTPSFNLSSTLGLTYTVAGFDITSTTVFGASGITAQGFSIRGAFGPFSISGKMRFDPAAVTYEVAQLVTSFDFGGVGIGLTVNHWLDGEWDAGYFGTTGADPCPAAPGRGNLQYIFTASIAPWSVRVRYLDCSAGTAFQDLLVTGSFDLCCGIKLSSSLSFTKAGFGSLVLSGLNIPLCCGVSFDVSITYTTTAKSVSVTPKFAGLGEACFTVWGGPVSGTTTNIWQGIRIDGYRIYCKLGDCNYLDYVHAFWPIQTTIPSAIRAKLGGTCEIYEYLEMGFCGAGCCGGRYEVSLRLAWGRVGAGLFGLTQFVGSAKIPIMTNFTLNLDFSMPMGTCGTPNFCFGWTFTF